MKTNFIMAISKNVFLLALTFGVAFSASTQNRNSPTLTYYTFQPFDGSSYYFSYSLSDGSTRQETGQFITDEGTSNGKLQVSGSFSYISPEGKYVHENYISDEEGFRILPEKVPLLGVPAGVVASLLG